MSLIIQTKNLSRDYEIYRRGEGFNAIIRDFLKRDVQVKSALSSCDLKIHQGDVVGLVGANGAGKTTLLKLLSGLIYPTAGEVRVLGFTPFERKRDFLRQISLLLGQKNQLWWDLPAAESFGILARIYSLDLKQARLRVKELAEILSCESLLEVPLRRLSLGERMKMELIGALLHRPRVLFLDEPTIGLDIVAQVAIRDFLREYVRIENPTVILTSHYMDDISLLANRLLLMSQGQIIYDGTVEGFVSKTKRLQKLTVQLVEPLNDNLELPGGRLIKGGNTVFVAELEATELAATLQIILSQAKIQEIKIDNMEFEEVIHEFFAQLPSRSVSVTTPAT